MTHSFFVYSWHIDEREENVTSIRAYGLNKNNENVCIRIDDFTPYVYVQLPSNISWNEGRAQMVCNKIDELLGQAKPIKKSLVFKKKLYYDQQTVIVVVGIVATILLIVGGYLLLSKKDNFNITTDPLRTSYDHTKIPLDKYPRAMRNGLNTENDNEVSICSFNSRFNNETEFTENENMDPCALTARQFCSVLYSGHEELFTNLYSGLGECEKAETEKCRECPNRLNVKKEREVYYTQLNKGV